MKHLYKLYEQDEETLLGQYWPGQQGPKDGFQGLKRGRTGSLRLTCSQRPGLKRILALCR